MGWERDARGHVKIGQDWSDWSDYWSIGRIGQNWSKREDPGNDEVPTRPTETHQTVQRQSISEYFKLRCRSTGWDRD